MALQFLTSIPLPEHQGSGGFDHATVHRQSSRLYVAHTINDAIDVIDCMTDQYLHSIPGLTGVAGALASDDHDLIFTSNRGENTVGIFNPEEETLLEKVTVGIRPNGLAFDPKRGHLIAANVGDPAIPGSFTLSLLNIHSRKMIASIPVAGRTRWAIYDKNNDQFFVNIADPPQIVVIDGSTPDRIARTIEIPVAGPHGLDLDVENQHLFCACDSKRLLTLQLQTGKIESEVELSGTPDVIFFNPALNHLYVAIGDPGVMDIFATSPMRLVENVPTEKGTHTIAFDMDRNKVYAFLPLTHRALVFIDVKAQ